MSERDSIISKIRKLQAFSTANGCTESEASLAAAKIAELMREHNVAMTELSVRADSAGCIKDAYSEINNQFGDWQYCVRAIGFAFSCKAYISTTTGDPLGLGMEMKMCQAEYFGFPADVCGAVALTAIVACALVTESDIYLKKHGGGKSAGTSFRRAMASRLQERIRALKIVPVSTGTALVVLKDQLVKAEFAKLGIRLTTVPSSSYKHNEHASASGRAAGDRVNIGQQSVANQRRLA